MVLDGIWQYLAVVGSKVRYLRNLYPIPIPTLNFYIAIIYIIKAPGMFGFPLFLGFLLLYQYITQSVIFDVATKH